MSIKKSEAMKYLDELTGDELSFGEFLKMLREGSEMTQADLATELGIGRGRICDYEANRRLPSLERAAAIADIIGAARKTLLVALLEEQIKRANLSGEVKVS